MVFPALQGPTSDGVYTIHLGNSENRIDFEYIQQMHEHLEKIERTEGPTACIVAGEGKFFSNGLDIDILMKQPKELLESFHRQDTEPLTTSGSCRSCGVCASPQSPYRLSRPAHCSCQRSRWGAMIALACDYRVMNRRKGFLCINEVDIGLPLTPGMCAIIKSKLDRSLWTPTILGAKRWGGEECLRNRIVDFICEPDEVMSRAQALAAQSSAKGATKNIYRALKEEMFAQEISLLSTGLGSAMHTVAMLNNTSKM